MSSQVRRDRELAMQYKLQADAILLSRGKKPGVNIGTSGKSKDEIFGILSALQKEGLKQGYAG